MGPDDGQLAVDSGFVHCEVGKCSIFRILWAEREGEQDGQSLKAAVSLGRRQGAEQAARGQAACHMLSLESHFMTPA